MQPNSFDVIRIPTNGPGDVSGLMALIDNGALDILYHQSTTSADIAKEHGSGTYQAKNHTLIFKYSDGRKIQIAFSGLNYDRWNQSPPSLN